MTGLVPRATCDFLDSCAKREAIDWFKGKITGTSHISWGNLWFPVKMFPSTNPLREADNDVSASALDLSLEACQRT